MLIFLNINLVISVNKYNVKNIIFDIKNNNINNNYYNNILKKIIYKHKFSINDIKFFLNFINHFNYIKYYKKKRGNILLKLIYKSIIYKIYILGNKLYNKREIINFLKKFNINYGKFFNYYNILKFKNFLINKYKVNNKLNIKIFFKKRKIKRKKILLIFKINENKIYEINNINIIGNKNFNKDIFLNFMKTKKNNNLLNFIFEYVFIYKIFLNDLKNIKNFYLINGYLDFKIKKVFFLNKNKNILDINIIYDEGNKYKIFDIIINSNIKRFNYLLNNIKYKMFKKKKLYKFNLINKIIIKINNFLKNKGYLNINTNIKYKKKRNNKIIFLINLELKNRFFINKIIFKGNKYFKYNYLIKNIPFRKGDIYNLSLIKKSLYNLKKNNFFKFIKIKRKQFNYNKVDIIYYIKENNDGIISFGLGYGRKSKINYNIIWSQKNILYSGSNFLIKCLKNKLNLSNYIYFAYPINNYKNIYIKHKLFLNKLIDNKLNDYKYLNLNYGIENSINFYIGEFLKYKIGIKYSHNYLYKVKSQLKALSYFYSMKKKFNLNSLNNFLFTNDVFLINNILYNKLDNNIFPNYGYKIGLLSKFTLFNSDNNFYKLFLFFSNYFSLDFNKNLIFSLNNYLGFSNGINNKILPFYENFNLNDNNFLRGLNYENIGFNEIFINSKSYKCDKNHIICFNKNSSNGNFILSNNLNVILPHNILLNNIYSKYIRISIFFDSGIILDTNLNNIFKDKYYNKMNYNYNNNYYDFIKFSVGISFKFITPIGPLNLSFGIPIKYNNFDEINYIQFNTDNFI